MTVLGAKISFNFYHFFLLNGGNRFFSLFSTKFNLRHHIVHIDGGKFDKDIQNINNTILYLFSCQVKAIDEDSTDQIGL